ncbi:MFS transporter [Nocardiopsis ansamitocini]|uniref:MFS transporter n=1 Tax=Nocardiopsis ansamitocini TaxID=1670832 RepID=A0A9W6P3S8_9ACTN|nr:MFS transporter [Nocardiopsis ansamitocini]GLU46552.1 MFS transporter [Nocardiopsis ansamitocini]
MHPPPASPTSRNWFPWLLVAVVLLQTAHNLARPLMSYLAISLGAGEVAIGLLTVAYSLVAVLAAVPLGRFTDRYPSSSLVLGAGIALLAAAAAILAVAPSLWVLALGGSLLGLGHLVFIIAGQGLIARQSPEHLLDRDFGWFTAAVAVGQMIGPGVAGLLLGDASGTGLTDPSRAALWIAVATALLAAPCLLGIAARLAPNRTAGAGTVGTVGTQPKVSLPSILRRPGIPSGLLVSMALLASVDILVAYLPLIAEQRGIAPVVAGALLSLRAVAAIASRLLLPLLLRRWTRRTLIMLSAGGAALALACVPLPQANPVTMGAALLVGGFLLGLGQPLTMTSVVRAVPASARSTALAIRLTSNRFGLVAMPAGAALIAGTGGAAGAVWFTCAVLALAGGAAVRTPPDRGSTADSA